MRPPTSPPVSDSAVARVRPRSRRRRPAAGRAGESLGGGEGEPALAKQPADDRLEGLLVEAVDDLAELPADPRLDRGDLGQRFLAGGADGGEADPDLARAGQIGQGDMAGPGV